MEGVHECLVCFEERKDHHSPFSSLAHYFSDKYRIWVNCANSNCNKDIHYTCISEKKCVGCQVETDVWKVTAPSLQTWHNLLGKVFLGAGILGGSIVVGLATHRHMCEHSIRSMVYESGGGIAGALIADYLTGTDRAHKGTRALFNKWNGTETDQNGNIVFKVK